MENTDTRKVHQGRNVKRFREMMGIKQEALAAQLGGDWSQKKISLLESKEDIDPALLNELAKALKVPAEAIKNFDEEKAIYNIQNNFEGSHNQGPNGPYQCTFNPLDEFRNEVIENRRLVEENRKLYEELLKTEKEKVALLERMLKRQDEAKD